VVRDELLDEEGTPRLVIAKTLAWVHRNAGDLETWRGFLDEQIAKPDIEPDTKACWLVAKAYAEALVSEEPDRLAGKTWLQAALGVAASPSLRLEAVRDLVLAYADANRYDQGLSFLETVAPQISSDAVDALRQQVRRMQKAYLEAERAKARWRAEYLEREAVEAAERGDEDRKAFFLRRAEVYRDRERALLERLAE